MVYVFVALGLVLWLLTMLLQRDVREARTKTAATALIVVFAGFAISQFFDAKLLPHAPRPWPSLRVLAGLELALVASYAFDARLPKGSRWPTIRFVLFGAGIAFGIYEVIHITVYPEIDVWTVQTMGANALLEGKNPFVETRVVDTTPGVFRNDVPYVYTPFQVLVTTPTQLLGDVRYTMGLAVLVAGIALRDIARRCGRDLPPIVTDAPALLVWMSPKLFFILEQAWNDPVQIALITTSTALAVRKRTWAAAIGFGLVLAAKQTMFWVAPLAFVAFAEFRWRHAALAVTLATSIYLPFALWNPPAFIHAAFGFVASLPARDDALSFINWASRALGIHIPYVIAFPLAAALVAYIVLKRRAEIYVYGIGLFITYFIFFTLNKWTYANYYFSLAGLAALAGALALHHRSRESCRIGTAGESGSHSFSSSAGTASS